MRDLINIISEAVTDNYLYHGTSVGCAVTIIQTNCLKAKTYHNLSKMVKHKGYRRSLDYPFRKKHIDNDKIFGTSTSRDRSFAQYWSSGVVFVLNKDIIKNNNRIVSIAYHTRDDDLWSSWKTKDEMEDFIVGQVNNIERAIVEIQITKMAYQTISNDDEFYELTTHPKLKIV